MSNSKHTPGPWSIHTIGDQHASGFTIDLRAHDSTLSVAAVYHNYTEEAEANASLIAAAPELLEALVEALEHVKDGATESHQLRVKIQRLLIKATGGAK